MTDERSVAVLGAGSTMGLAMARNIARAGIPVRAWNRTAAKARPLEDDGVRVVDGPAEAWVLAVVEAGAEIIALAERLNVDPGLFFEAIEGGSLDLPYLRLKARAITERDFAPSFRLGLAAKDAGLIEESARRHAIDLPLFATIRRRLEEGAIEHGDEDLSATYLTLTPSRRIA